MKQLRQPRLGWAVAGRSDAPQVEPYRRAATVGSVSAPEYELGGLALDWKAGPNTYVGVVGQVLRSEVKQRIGLFRQDGFDSSTNSSTRENLDYEEESLSIWLHQLLSDEWAVGFGYRLTSSDLSYRYREFSGLGGDPSRTETAELHHLHSQLSYHHRAGLFGRVDADWLLQDNDGYRDVVNNRSRPRESVYQLNLSAGYRFWRRRGEVMIGILNITAQDYRLNSLTPFAELPRERVFYTRAKFNF